MTWNFKARPFAPRKSEPARSPALQKSEPNLDKTYGVIHDNNNTEVREASHIDFAHKKRQLYVSLETPPPLPWKRQKCLSIHFWQRYGFLTFLISELRYTAVFSGYQDR